MRPQRIPTRMRNPLPRAVRPLATILLLPRMDMLIMQMQHQRIHIPHLARIAALPPAKRNLLPLVEPAVVFVAGEDRGGQVRRPGDGAVGVGGEVLVWVWWGQRVEGAGLGGVDAAVAVGVGACLLALGRSRGRTVGW